MISAFYSCQFGQDRKQIDKEIVKPKLKSYQQLALNRIRQSDNDDGIFSISDGFYKWDFRYFGRVFKQNCITRIDNDTFYAYTFWRRQKDTAIIYNEVLFPKSSVLKDTLYDINGDNFKDLLVKTSSRGNNQCNKIVANLFCLDSANNKFQVVEQISSMANPQFDVTRKTVHASFSCKNVKTSYMFKWTDDFKLDTVYYKTEK